MAGGKGSGEVDAPVVKSGGVDLKYYESREVVDAFNPLRQVLEEVPDLFGSDKVRLGHHCGVR